MTPEEILKKCEEYKVKLYVKGDKLTPAGNLPMEFIKVSASFVPYKQQIIDYIRANRPELVLSDEQKAVTPAVNNTPNNKIQRLRIPCVHLGPPLEKAAGCGCNGAVIHKCAVFEKCRRVGNYPDIAVCTSCERYEGIHKN